MEIWYSITLAFFISLNISFISQASGAISTIKLQAHLEDSDGEPELIARSKSNKYDVGETELSGAFFAPASGPGVEISGKSMEEPKNQSAACEIELWAAEDYYFGTMEQNDIKIVGLQGVCTRAVRKNNGDTLVLTVQLTEFDQYVGRIEAADFQDGQAVWKPAINASTYILTLYNDGRKQGMSHETGGTSFDFTPLMTKAGCYTYRIAPVSANGKPGKYVRSEECIVGDVQAKKNKDHFAELKKGWQPDKTGWKFWCEDGIYIQDNWQQEEHDWYYLDADGYMVTNDGRFWKKVWYSFGEDGKMLMPASQEL